MKTTHRIPKAIAVIIVVGFGLLHNMKGKSIVMEPLREITAEFDKSQIKSDSIQTSESKLFIYTKSFINTSIHQLISNL
jgi:large-conductance mechanosensitive channel